MSATHVTGPLGVPASAGARRRAERSADYCEEQARVAPYEGLARLIVDRRAALGLTQLQLAERMGTSHSAISRIESGRHPARLETLRRLAEALEVRLVIGFESGPDHDPGRELVPFDS